MKPLILYKMKYIYTLSTKIIYLKDRLLLFRLFCLYLCPKFITLGLRFKIFKKALTCTNKTRYPEII